MPPSRASRWPCRSRFAPLPSGQPRPRRSSRSPSAAEDIPAAAQLAGRIQQPAVDGEQRVQAFLPVPGVRARSRARPGSSAALDAARVLTPFHDKPEALPQMVACILLLDLGTRPTRQTWLSSRFRAVSVRNSPAASSWSVVACPVRRSTSTLAALSTRFSIA